MTLCPISCPMSHKCFGGLGLAGGFLCYMKPPDYIKPISAPISTPTLMENLENKRAEEEKRRNKAFINFPYQD
jgi:hypothetical protein